MISWKKSLPESSFPNLVQSLTYDRTQAEEGSDVKIPIGDVYNAFISNEILNVGHLRLRMRGD